MLTPAVPGEHAMHELASESRRETEAGPKVPRGHRVAWSELAGQ